MARKQQGSSYSLVDAATRNGESLPIGIGGGANSFVFKQSMGRNNSGLAASLGGPSSVVFTYALITDAETQP
eukprot:1987575-Prymnesium_polylepis.1